MEVETIFHPSIKANEPISRSKQLWNRRIIVLWVELWISKYCKGGMLAYSFPGLFKNFEDRQDSMGRAKNDIAATIESHRKVLGSR